MLLAVQTFFLTSGEQLRVWYLKCKICRLALNALFQNLVSFLHVKGVPILLEVHMVHF